MTVPVKTPAQGDIMESVIAKGDLARLTPDERVRYYNEVCKSLGLNPLTMPFSYMTLSGRLTLYATRACADQLRKINGVSLEILSREVVDDILTIHVRATLPDGRKDEDLGAVAFPSALKGEARVNAELKAVTKAKRRTTLSICGLGWLDETEVEDIPASAKRPPPQLPEMAPMPPAPAEVMDAQTGEIIEPPKSEPAKAKPVGRPRKMSEAAAEPVPNGVPTWQQYVSGWRLILHNADNAEELRDQWNREREVRNKVNWPDLMEVDKDPFVELRSEVEKAIKQLRDGGTA